MWKLAAKVVKPTAQPTPKAIQQNGKVIRKPAEIANAANIHYYTKIDKMRQNLEIEKRDPLSMLKLVMPRNEIELNIPLITLAQTKHLIRTFKSSGSTGYDDLSSKTIKKIGDLIAPQICI